MAKLKQNIPWLILLTLIGCGGSKTVRPDVADYITSQYASKPRLQKALTERALLYQEAGESLNASSKIRPELERTLRCVRYLEPQEGRKINREFLKKVFDTAERMKLYAKMNQKFSGGAYVYKTAGDYDCND